MHVQFFPVYVLTCGAHNSKPSLGFDLEADFFESPDSLLTELNLYDEIQAAGVSGQPISRSFLEISNFMCPLQGLGLLGSLGQIPLFFDPHSLQGVYLGY